MPLPRSIARVNRAVLNHVLRPLARYLPGFGVVVHRGRRSGRIYRTPVNVFKQPNGYVIALTYGVGDWPRNVLAARECRLVTTGRSHHLFEPRLVHDEHRQVVPAMLRFVGAIGNVTDFLYLSADPSSAAMRTQSSRRVPSWMRVFNPGAKLLLAIGVPMGPEVLLTVRGRKTGLPRSTPVAVAEIAGRWWLIGPFGEGDWVRNLRAAGRGTLTNRRAREEITATELDREQKLRFFRDMLDPYLRTRGLARWIVRNLDRIPDDPVEAAKDVFVFEAHRAPRSAGRASALR